MKRTRFFKKFCALTLTAVSLITLCGSSDITALADDYEEGYYYSDEQDFEEESSNEVSYYSTGESTPTVTEDTSVSEEGIVNPEIPEEEQEEEEHNYNEAIDISLLYPEDGEWSEFEYDANYAYWVGEGMEEKYVEARKAKAKELGLEGYLNNDYYLNSEYYLDGVNDPYNLIEQGGFILVQRATCDEQGQGVYWDTKTAKFKVSSPASEEDETAPAVAMFAMTRSSAVASVNLKYEDTYDDTVYRKHGYYTTNSTGISATYGSTAQPTYCLSNSKTDCHYGSSAYSCYEGPLPSGSVNWTGVCKALYYGYGGPGQAVISEYCGNNVTKMITLTAETTSYYNSGYSFNSSATAEVNWRAKLDGLSLPSGYRVFSIDTGTHQPRVFGFQDVSQGKISVQKVSADSTKTSGNSYYSLEGAVYRISTSGGTPVVNISTNSDGYAESVDLNEGDYLIQEISAPKGYAIDNTQYSVHVSAGTTNRASMNARGNHSESPKTGKIELTKESANPDCTDNNPNYSLEFAEYGVYSNEACTDRVETIITDKEGKGYCKNLALGNYWVKEVKASQGYDLDTNVYHVEIANEDGTNEIVRTINSKETPRLDPVSFALKKVDSDTGGAAVGSGSMEDAHYELKFYTDIMTTDPALSGKTPLRTWVLKTTAEVDGATLRINDASKISGDAFWYDEFGGIAFPYGTLTIHEIKSPNGYLLNNDTIVVPINGSEDNPDPQYHEPIQKEVALRINIVKYQSGTDKPIKGATFRHTKPDGTTEDLVTDENGQLSFKGLQWGYHVVEEIGVMDGFEVNKNQITFNVSDTNEITITSSAKETDTNGNVIINVGDDGNLNATVYDKASPFDLHIHKINNHNLSLRGAEFTLYSDASCRNVVARKVSDTYGNLTFEDLIPERVYYLKETKAPAGYRIPINKDGSDIVWKIQVVSYPTEGVFNFYVNDKAYTVGSTGDFTVTGATKDRVCNMSIVNQVGNKLPVTGSNGTLILIGVGVALIGVAFILGRKKKLLI